MQTMAAWACYWGRPLGHLRLPPLPLFLLLLLVVLWGGGGFAATQGISAVPGGKPVVCLRNIEGNPRTASLFERGTLNRGAFHYVMAPRARKQGLDCDHTVLLVEHSANSPNRIEETRRQMALCRQDSPCVITGDEFCSYPPGSNPHVIGRFYYSSDYADMPVFGLGPIIGFNVKPPNQLPPPQQLGAASGGTPRRYLFNFIGSEARNAQKRDRAAVMTVLGQTTADGKSVFNAEFYSQLTSRLTVERRNEGAAKQMIENYKQVLVNSSFTLDPVGDHDDCFRFWEAVQAGSVPVFVRRVWGIRKGRTPAETQTQLSHFHHGSAPDAARYVSRDSDMPFVCPDAFENVLATNPPIVLLDSWEDLPAYMNSVTPAQIHQLQSSLAVWHRQWWDNQTKLADGMIRRAFGLPGQL